MSKAAYVGIDGLARKVKKMYVGIDGVAHKIKKGYIGIDGVARQFFSSGKLVVHPTVALTANSSNGYVASCSTCNSNSYDAYRAFNKTYSNQYGWVSKASTTDGSPYLQIKLPSALKITGFSLANRTFSSYVNGITAGTIKGSPDGSTWTTICTISGRDGSTSGLLTEHECTDPETAYQYVRVVPTSWPNKGVSGGNSYVAIGELYITCLEEE